MAESGQASASGDQKGCSLAIVVPAVAGIIVALIAAVGAIVAALIGQDEKDPEAVVQLLGVSCDPAVVQSGSRVKMSFPMKVSGDEGAQKRIWLGATLYLGDGQEVYDEDGDRQVTVVPGEYNATSAPDRTFVIPEDTAPGDYELGGEIWDTEPGADEDATSNDDKVCPITVGP